MRQLEAVGRDDGGDEADLWRPLLFDRGHEADAARMDELLASGQVWRVQDTIRVQLRDLIGARAPKGGLSAAATDARVDQLLAGQAERDFGRWAFYQWSGYLVHVLGPSEFRELRLDRNRHKITTDDQERLWRQCVGIVGLSAGNSVALALALEETCGYLKLADFDDLGLSSLNRVPAGVHDLGLRKTVLAARRIYELNPYAGVVLFNEGLTQDNLDDFLSSEPRVDVVVDECDDLYMKLRLRERATQLKLPVLMATSDGGMLDIERFDCEPERPLLHGTTQGVSSANCSSMDDVEKLGLVLSMLGTDAISGRAAASLVEIKQTLSTWPQLASDVMLGGAGVATAIRQLALGDHVPSGRRYVRAEMAPLRPEGHAIALREKECESTGAAVNGDEGLDDRVPALIRFVVRYAILAPSGGNSQPWRFYFDGTRLWVVHVARRSANRMDADNRAAYIALGAAIENLAVAAAHAGHHTDVEPFPRPDEGSVVAALTLTRGLREDDADLAPLFPQLTRRATNRTVVPSAALTARQERVLEGAVKARGARLELVTADGTKAALGRMVGKSDRIRFLCPELHRELAAELRWSSTENRQRRDGIDVKTLGLRAPELSILRILTRPDVAGFLRTLGGGEALEDLSFKALTASAAVGLISMERNSDADMVRGGRAVEHLWLHATRLGLSLQPVTALVYMLDMLETDAGNVFTTREREALLCLGKDFNQVFAHPPRDRRLLLFRVGQAPEPSVRSLRLPLNEILYFGSPDV